MILGIDLGTSTSMAAAFKDGEVVLVKSVTGSYTIPSVISMDEEGTIYTGDMALKRKKQYPDMTVDMFKCSMGIDKEFILGDKKYSAEELSAILLRAIKEEAENFFDEVITEAVISVPACFNHFQRKSLMQAGKRAGFDVKRIVNEPTAAAIAYKMQNMETESGKKVIILLDLGGGTVDISVMESSGNVLGVVAVCGDNKLGGDDFTRRLVNLFKENNSIDCHRSKDEESSLWSEAQKAKHQISVEGKGEIRCTIDGRDYEYSITEAEYEDACVDLLEKIRKLTLQAVEESGYEPNEVKDIIMVGGGSKLSIVKKMIERMTSKEIDYKMNPDEAVVRGAALQGTFLNHSEDGREIVIHDICSHYIGCLVANHWKYDKAKNYDVIIKKNTKIPVKKTITHYMEPGTCIFGVWQCENELGIGAALLDSLRFVVPNLGNDNEIEVEKSIVYDENGIIYAEVLIPATGMKYTKVVQGEGLEISETELEKNIEKYETEEIDENVLLLERAEKVYAETTGNDRKMIGDYIKNFESALLTDKKTKIEKARDALKQVLDAYENSIGEL